MKHSLLLLIIMFIIGNLWADTEKIQAHIGINHVYFIYWYLPSGLVMRLDLNDLKFFPGSRSSLSLTLGGGVTQIGSYRDSNSKQYSTSNNFNSTLNYWAPYVNIEYSAFLNNDFAPTKDYHLGPFIAFRGYSAIKTTDKQLIWDSGEDTVFRHEFLIGFIYSTLRLTRDIFALNNGFYLESSLGYAIGSTPRINMQARIYEQIVRNDWFVLEFKARILIDYIFSRPRYDDYGFLGGSILRRGLGDTIRGFESSSYDSGFKTAVNTELHLVFAPFKHLISIALNPGILIFSDFGYYHDNRFSNDARGVIMSVGGGISFDIFNNIILNCLIAVPIIGQRLDNASTYFLFGFRKF